MVRFNNTSILRRLDLDNTNSLKRVLNVLTVTLEGGSSVLEISQVSGNELSLLESQWVKAVLRAIQTNTDHPLLMRAIIRFCGARKESVAGLNAAVKELENLAGEDVLTVPGSHFEEYNQALAQFDAIPPTNNQLRLEEAYV
jgi:hypothetical protein